MEAYAEFCSMLFFENETVPQMTTRERQGTNPDRLQSKCSMDSESSSQSYQVRIGQSEA